MNYFKSAFALPIAVGMLLGWFSPDFLPQGTGAVGHPHKVTVAGSTPAPATNSPAAPEEIQLTPGEALIIHNQQVINQNLKAIWDKLNEPKSGGSLDLYHNPQPAGKITI